MKFYILELNLLLTLKARRYVKKQEFASSFFSGSAFSRGPSAARASKRIVGKIKIARKRNADGIREVDMAD